MDYDVCPQCGSTNLASLRQDSCICIECSWHTDDVEQEELISVILRYDECEEK